MFLRKVFGDYYSDRAETFVERRRDELRRHQIEHVVRNVAVAGGVAGLADGERRIEEEGLCFAIVLSREVEKWPAIAAVRLVASIHVTGRCNSMRCFRR